MKIKTTANLIAFATTLLFSLVIVALPLNRLFSFSHKEDDFKAKLKLYNFLKAEKARNDESLRWSIAHTAKLKEMTMNFTISLSPEMKDRYIKEFRAKGRAYLDGKANADTTGLPEDFREIWAKFNAFYKECSEVDRSNEDPDVAYDREIARSREYKSLENEYRSVVKSYGFDLDRYLDFVDK